MSDLISREAVLNLYEEYRARLATNVCEFGDALEQIPPAEPQEWISVKDRLPNEECECWMTLEYIKTGNRVLYESHYDTVLERFYNQKSLERQGYKLIAWQKKSLPSPYKGGE